MLRSILFLVAPLLLVFAIGGPVTPTSDVSPEPTQVAVQKPSVTESVLKRGETLEAALIKQQIDRSEAAKIIHALRSKISMRKIQPGERLVITWSEGKPSGIVFWRTLAERYEVSKARDGWIAKTVSTPVDTRIAAVTGAIEGSLFESMERLRESPMLTAKFVNLFEWDFDFAADSLPGDRFRLLVEKRFVQGAFLGYGDILIAQYKSTGRRALTAVAFEGKDGKTRYYDAEGRSVRKMFLRAPLDFTRITSGFSHARRHPILGGVRPHLAIDYGAPEGTPVRAVADGAVRLAGWAGGNGLSVTLHHARGYQTMYNHLSKITVKNGERVRQRQIIGRVGSTGLSTGPHLDYRVIKDQRFVNPLSEKFIPGDPVSQERWKAFKEQLKLLSERLDREAPLTTPAAGSHPSPQASSS